MTDSKQQDILLESDLEGRLPLIAKGKVRDLYAIDDTKLLLVSCDRISAYDVIMKNVSRVFTIENVGRSHFLVVSTCHSAVCSALGVNSSKVSFRGTLEEQLYSHAETNMGGRVIDSANNERSQLAIS